MWAWKWYRQQVERLFVILGAHRMGVVAVRYDVQRANNRDVACRRDDMLAPYNALQMQCSHRLNDVYSTLGTQTLQCSPAVLAP